MDNIKYNNNYSVAEIIFDEMLNWTANKSPLYDNAQMIGRIEDILDKVEEKGYNRAKGGCCGGNE